MWNIKTSNAAITSIEVFNVLGKRIISQNNSNDVTISTQGLTNGLYIAKLLQS